MGQYWKIVNLDKREFVYPHTLGVGLKLIEQVMHPHGCGTALLLLCAAMPEPRGSGDLDIDDDVAKRTIGRWAGDRVCLVGDYAEDSDVPGFPEFSKVYDLCSRYEDVPAAQAFKDISDDVLVIINRVLGYDNADI